jgi:AGCS family alanine or glycine:cation symporter
MLNLENTKRSFAVCLSFFCLSLDCFGSDKGASPDWQAKVDQFFGEYVVSPIADLLFWKIPGTHYYEEGSPVYSFSSNQLRQLTDQHAKGGGYTFNNGDLRVALLKDGRWESPDLPTFKTKYENFSNFQKEYLKDENIGPIGFISIKQGFPLIVAWLLGGSLFFTLRMRFVNLRLFKHAIDLVRGKHDSKDQKGEVTHFQALTTALSATVGLGNIAGVAIAIGTGGPGATFWIILVGFLGMSSKFTECVLGQKYRKIRKDGKIMGGAMHYLSDGLKDLKLKHLGGLLAGLFCLLCIGGSFGGGNAFQVVQSLDLIKSVFPVLQSYPWVYGLIMTMLVSLVILGGIKGIANVASRVVPAMCAIYLLACLVILGMHFDAIPGAIALIFKSAFSLEAGFGGFLGILVIGVKRAVFSNEAGIGSAAIAHSAAKVSHPTEEGVVALLEPFIDTIVVCTMTALVIIITGVYEPLTFTSDPGEQSMIQGYIDGNKGGALTSTAMKSVIPWFPYVLSIAVFLFAFSTMISWSYYGERCWVWLFGDRSSIIYKLLFLISSFLGSIITATNVLDFSDLMILGMAFPNILGMLLLSRVVRNELRDYEQKRSRPLKK